MDVCLRGKGKLKNLLDFISSAKGFPARKHSHSLATHHANGFEAGFLVQ